MNENKLIRQFVQQAEEALQQYLNEYGLLICSSIDSLRPDNPIVYWGFNPGQDPCIDDETHWKIGEAICKFRGQADSLIDHQDWPNARVKPKAGKYPKRYGAGQAPFQKGVRHLLSFIEHPDALVTNFFFFQTARAEHCKLDAQQINACWEIHRYLLKATGARLIITTQGVVSELNRHDLMRLHEEKRKESGYSTWPCVLYRNEKDDDLRGLHVLAAPHMSYWGKGIEQDKYTAAKTWIKDSVDAVLLGSSDAHSVSN